MRIRRDYILLLIFVVATSILFSGARIASTDELSIFLTTESIAERGEFSISHDLVVNGMYGKDGKFYSGVGIAQPALSIPFYVGGKLIADILHLSKPTKAFVIKAAVSLLNQIFAGLIAVVMFAFGRKLGYSLRLSLFLTIGLLFTTNLFPYLKSYMREPQLLFYLLAATYYLFKYKLANKRSSLVLAGAFCGMGLLTRLTSVITIPLLYFYLLYVLWSMEGPVPRIQRLIRGTLDFGFPVVIAVVITFIYNYVQFGAIFSTPYAKAEFTTPILAGLYGLLLSSGKSLFLYAPLVILLFASISRFGKQHKAEMILFVALVAINLVFFGKFVSWAGDGSWGPRYLVPILPFLILPCGVLLHSSKTAKRVALGLAAIGLIIQIGGVSIYLGNYHREIGEFPYTRDFSDPEFLYKSHFVPNYSPVFGHWRMLVRNTGLALSGEKPALTIGDTNTRIPLSEETKSNLLYTLDFWFMYAWYAGVRPAFLMVSVLVLLGLSVFLGWRMMRAFAVLSTSPT